MYKVICGVLMVFIISCTSAQSSIRSLSCRVIGVSDGDTLTCLLKSNKSMKIRLAGIDAPEKAQPFGHKSRQLLANLLYKRNVTLRIQGYDRYHRILATVYDEQNRNINLIMLQQGMAWVYQGYKKNSDYLYAQQQAQQKKLGLWSEPYPISPQEWRRRYKK